MHVSLPETSAHDPHDVGTKLGVEETDDIGIDGAVEHERPQRHLVPRTKILLGGNSLL